MKNGPPTSGRPGESQAEFAGGRENFLTTDYTDGTDQNRINHLSALIFSDPDQCLSVAFKDCIRGIREIRG
jgi:hypothetical protein